MSTSESIETTKPKPEAVETGTETKTDPIASLPAEDAPPAAPSKASAETLVAEGKKAIALKKWEEGVAKYADALDMMREVVGDQDPTMAPLLLSYGKALFELAVSQSGVMGKEEAPKEEEDDDEGGPSTLIESADPEILAEAEAAAAAAEQGEDVPAEEAPSGGEADVEEEPEDDYNAAWEVIDVARTIYLRIIEDAEKKQGGKGKGKASEAGEGGGNDEIKQAQLMLAECYETLGDISCETEKFEQAASDYTSSLNLLTPHHPTSARIIATLHFTLGTALEFIPNRRADALSHVQSALSSFQERQQDLNRPLSEMQNKDLAKLSEKDKEAEKKEVAELIGDLEVKVEELKSAPPVEEESISQLLGGGEAGGFGFGSASGSGVVKKDEGPVNDMSGMVKRKKKPVAPAPTQAGQASMNGGSGSAPTVAGVVEGAKNVAESVKEKARTIVEKAADKVIDAVSTENGSGKRVAEGEDVERESKKARVD